MSSRIPFSSDFLDLGSLRADVRWLAILGFGLVLAGGFLLALVSVPFPTIRLAGPLRIGIPFYVGIVVLSTVGWGYLLAGALGAGKALRWSSLAIFTGVTLWSGRAVFMAFPPGDVAGLLLQLAPFIPLMVVWPMAITRTARQHQSIGILTVSGAVASLVAFFVGDQVGSIAGASTTGVVGVGFMNYLLTTQLLVFAPILLMAGSDTAEMIIGTCQEAGRRLERLPTFFRGRLPALLVVIGAVAFWAVTRPEVSLLNMVYTAAWAIGSLLLLVWSRASASDDGIPVGAAFAVVVALWVAYYLLLSAGGSERSVFQAHLVTAGLSIAVAAVVLVRAPRRWASLGVLLGLVGIWGLFENLPRVLDAQPLRVETGAPLILGLALLTLTLGAEFNRRLAPLRDILAIGTLAVILIELYVDLVFGNKPISDFIVVLQIVFLIAAFVTHHGRAPIGPRLLAAAVVGGALGTSLVFELINRPVPLTLIAMAALAAVGLIWDAWTSGGRLTNKGSQLWPRDSRVVGYFGYVLVGLALALLFFAVPNLRDTPQLVTVLPAAGLRLLGVPIVTYILWVVWQDRQLAA